jgi:hypothetical protein
VINESTDKTVYYCPLTPSPRFEENEEPVAGIARLRCSFPHEGRSRIQFWFYQDQGSDVLKGEIPFSVERNGGSSMTQRSDKTKSGKIMLGPTLQLFELVPITDPAEIARIDRNRKAVRKAIEAAEWKSNKRKSPKRK